MNKWIVCCKDNTFRAVVVNWMAHSSWVCAERYRKADMQIRPYRFSEFNGANDGSIF